MKKIYIVHIVDALDRSQHSFSLGPGLYFCKVRLNSRLLAARQHSDNWEMSKSKTGKFRKVSGDGKSQTIGKGLGKSRQGEAIQSSPGKREWEIVECSQLAAALCKSREVQASRKRREILECTILAAGLGWSIQVTQV